MQGVLTPFDRLEGFERKQKDGAGSQRQQVVSEEQEQQAQSTSRPGVPCLSAEKQLFASHNHHT